MRAFAQLSAVRAVEAAPLVSPPAAASRRITIAPVGDWKHAAKALLLGSKLNVLLICIPVALICAAASAGNGVIFFFALASIWCVAATVRCRVLFRQGE